jgi:hypothetical protein
MNNLTGTTKEWHSIVASRLLNLERELQDTKTLLDKLANIVATNSTRVVGGVGAGNKPAFLTMAEQAKAYLDLALTQEQIELVRGARRDENTSRLRGEVICNLYKKGISANQIKIVLGKDHNSIYYHLAMAGLVKARDNKQYSARRASRLAKLKRMTSPKNKW